MSFFGMGPMEIGVILVIALIIFGPGKLPEIGAQVGKGIRDFRAATGDITGEFQKAMGDFQGVADEVRQSAVEVQETTRSLTHLDGGMTPASRPARPLPASATGIPVEGPATPTKDDPLADLMIG
jgi:TatA/E family protein of Tat protein translocase